MRRRKRAAPRPAPDRSAGPRAFHGSGYCLLGFTALLVATPMIPSESAAKDGTDCVLLAAWLLLLVAFGLWRYFSRDARLRVGWPTVLLAGVVAWHVGSGLIMLPDADQRATINSIWQWVGYGVAFFLARQLVVQDQAQRAVCATMLALAAGLSAHGYYQHFYSLPRDEAEYFRDPDAKLADAGIHAPAGSVARKMFESRLQDHQPFATFGLTNSLAGMLTPWLVLALGIWRTNWSLLKCHRRAAAGLLLCVFMISGCLLLTRSRSGLLSVLLGGVMVVVVAAPWATVARKTKRRLAGAGALLLLGLLAVWQSGLGQPALAAASRSLAFRFQYWRASGEMIREHPWWGCGPGNFQEYYTQYKLPDASESVTDPHNFLVEIAATAGVPAAIMMFAFLLAVCWIANRAGGQLAPKPVASKPVASTAKDAAASDVSRGFVYVGGLLGMLFAFPAGAVMDSAPQSVAFWLGLPIGVACLALLDGWVVDGACSFRLYLIAAAAQLFNLLAAGGIGFPSVSLSGWLLLALALNASENGRPATELVPAFLSRYLAAPALALAAGFLFTGYLPVIRAHQALAAGRILDREGAADRAETLYRRASELDPAWPMPWAHLASLRQRRWIRDPTQLRAEEFANTVQELRRRRPKSSILFRQVGDWYLATYRATGDSAALLPAVEALDKACRLHPHLAMRHAELAWACWLAAQPQRAAQEAEEALRLDSLMPHPEQKLAEQRLFDGQGEPERPGRSHPASQNAEQRMRWLRNYATDASAD